MGSLSVKWGEKLQCLYTFLCLERISRDIRKLSPKRRKVLCRIPLGLADLGWREPNAYTNKIRVAVGIKERIATAWPVGEFEAL